MATRNLRMVAALCLGLLCTAASADRPTVGGEELAMERLARQTQRTILDARMQAEGREYEWATEVEDDLRAGLAEAANVDLEIGEVSCAATLCRVLLKHDSPATQQHVMTNIAGTPGFDVAGFAHLEWEGSGRDVTTYIYLLRSGAAWPQEISDVAAPD